MKRITRPANSLSSHVILAAAAMIVALVLLAAVALSALDGIEQSTTTGSTLAATAIRQRTVTVFAMTTLVLGLGLAYLGARLVANTRRVRLSEARFRALFETGGDAILLVRPGTFTIEDANPAGARLLGLPAPAVAGSGLLEWFASDDAGEVRRRLQEAAATGSPARVEAELTGPDGATRPVLVTAGRIESDARTLLQVGMTDLSARTAAEHECMAEYRKLLAIFDSIDEPVYVADPGSHEILYANGALRELLGDVTGRTCYEALQGLDEPCPFCTNDLIFGANLGRTHEWEYHHALTDRWYRCIDKAIPWPDGRHVRYEMALDITQLVETRQALRQSKERYEELADSLPQAIFETDAQGIITLANRAAYRTFGYTEEDLIRGTSIFDMISPHERQRAGENMQRRMSGEDVGGVEYEVLRSDGSIFPAIVYADPIVRDGRTGGPAGPQGIRGIVADISEQKAHEEQVRERLLFEQAVAKASAVLVAEADLNEMLRTVGETVGVSRTYIFQLRDGGAKMDNTHEWCAPDVEPEAERLQDLPTDVFPWWMARLNAGAEIVLTDVASLPPEAANEREILQAQGIRSLIVVPVESASGELIGFLGADETRQCRQWQREEGRLLRLIAQRLAIYWQRLGADEELRLTNARLELLNSMSDLLNAGAPLSEAIQASCDGLRGLFGYDYVELLLPLQDDYVGQDGPADHALARAGGQSSGVRGLGGPLVGRARLSRLYDDRRLVEFRGRDEILPLIVDLAPPGEAQMTDLAPRIYDILGVDYICQIPMLCNGEAVGHLAVGKADSKPLPEQEKAFLAQFAEQLALIIAKARAEEDLRDSEQRHRVLFESSRDATMTLEPPTWKFTSANPATLELFGVASEADFTVLGLWDVSPHRQPDGELSSTKAPRMIETAMEAGSHFFEWTHRRTCGGDFPATVLLTRVELGDRTFLQATVRDISEQKRHEERLRQVNECFLGFGPDPMENIESLTALCGEVLGADWTVYVRRQGEGPREAPRLHMVSSWNTPEGFAPPADPGGCICEDVMAGDERVVALRDLPATKYAARDPNVRDFGARSYLGKAVVSHGGTVGSVCAFFRGDGEATESDTWLMGIIAAAIRVEEERRQVRDQRGRALVGLKLLNRDLERARREAEEGNRLKSEFLANTSHEIRTPLNGIIGYLQLVLNGLCDSREEEREFLEGAMDSARHLLSLINDVLDVAKIEAGKLRIEAAAVKVSTVLADIHSLARVQADQAGLELVFRPVPADLTAWCDAERLKQVLINLLGNAIKFTPEGGTVTVSVAPLEGEGAIRFEVSDTGIGIAPDKLDTIFDKFVQADGSTTRSQGGSGLGLTIGRRLVELMGGAMGARSRGEGRGSTFFFTMPVHRDGPRAGWGGPLFGGAPTEAPGAPLVLVVEDDPLYRDYLCDLLQKHGCATMWAATADDALLAVEEHVPRVVTIDYSLPAREGARLNTGWDLLVELQTDERLARTAMILVTGDSEVIGRRLAVEELPAGVDVVDKRDVGDKLAAAIEREVVSDERALRVLLADDDANFSVALRALLDVQGHDLQVVRDGPECLSYLAAHAADVDLLLLDLRMPGLDGFEVLRRIRLMDAGADLPVLVVTAWPEPATLDERVLLAGGGLARLLTKQEVLAEPSRLCAMIERFVHADVPGGGDGTPRATGCDARADAA